MHTRALFWIGFGMDMWDNRTFFFNNNLSSVFIAEHSTHCQEQREKGTSQQASILTLFFPLCLYRLQNTSWQLCLWQVLSLEAWWGVPLGSSQASKWQELQLHLVVGFWASQVENWSRGENKNWLSRSLPAVRSFLAKEPKNPAEAQIHHD